MKHRDLNMAARKNTISGHEATFALLIALIVVLAAMACAPAATPSPQPTPAPPSTSSPAPTETVITPADSPSLPSRGFYMGLLPIPAEGQSLADAYKETSKYAEFVPVWGRPTPFYDMPQELSGDWGQTFVEQYTRGNGMFPLFHLSFIGAGMTLQSPPGVQNATLANQDWRNAYKQAALDIVRLCRPRYLSLGNEVNRWYEQYGARDGDPNGFQNYVSLYNETYDAVKELSPQILVFCTFAREMVSQNREADLSVIDMFDAGKMDLLVFTSYPFSVASINRPEDIPDDYYTRALSYMPGKPFGFSELGWSALDAFGGEQSQADFIVQAAGRLTLDRGINLKLFGWPWLSALNENDTVALIKRDGSPRLAYKTWQELSVSSQ
jgi:hypothetical protein